jgi:outer membrane protein assembly factor BamB
MMDGPAIGPDGTLYLVRLSASTSSTYRGMGATITPLKYELVAINPSTGATKWKLEITARMVSEPAFAKDNTIYITASDSMMNPGTTTATGKSRLLIITPGGTARTITLDSDVLSTPKVVETGSLSGVYVTGFEMGNDTDTIASGTKTLYAFNLDGTTKFSINANQP